LQTIKISVL